MPNLNRNICGCGDCRAAADRARKIVCDMIADDECAAFITAVAVGMTEFTQYLLSASVAGMSGIKAKEANDNPMLRSTLDSLAVDRMEQAAVPLTEFMRNENYRFAWEEVAEAYQKYILRMKAEAEAVANDEAPKEGWTPKKGGG